MELTFKDLKKEHIPELTQLYIDAFNSPPWNDGWTIENASKRLIQMINCEGFYGMVCYENNTIVGMILGNHEYYFNGMHFNIKEFCVDPNCSGNGIGSKIINEFLKRLKDKGISEAILFTSRTDKTEGFYKNRGFESFDDMVIMGKKL